MISNVLKSESAVQVSIRIIDVFVRLREVYAEQTEVWLAIEKIKSKLDNQDKNMEIVFRYLDELIDKKQEPQVRRTIGFKPDGF